MQGLTQVRRELAYNAARAAKRSVLKHRMRLLREAAIDSLKPWPITQIVRAFRGLHPLAFPLEYEIRDEMRRLLHKRADFPVSYRTASWGIMHLAEDILALCRVSCTPIVWLDADGAMLVNKYLADNNPRR